MKDYYKLLNVTPDANSKQIEEAYRKFRQKTLEYLPPGMDANPDELVRTQFPDVVEAYTVLSNPQQRKAYDAERKKTPFAAGPEALPRKSSQDKVLLEFNPNNRSRRIVMNIIMILGILDLAAAIGLIVMFTVEGQSKVESMFHRGSAVIEQWLTAMLVLSVLLIVWRWIFNPLARLIIPYRNLVFGYDALYLQLRNGKEERIRAVTCYKYFFIDVFWLNLYTESGRKISFYMPVASCFHSDVTTDELSAYCARAKVGFALRPFLLVNAFIDSAPKIITKRKGFMIGVHVLLGLLELGYFVGSIVLAAFCLFGMLHIAPKYEAYANYYYLAPVILGGMALMLFKSFSNVLNRAFVR